MPFGPAKTLNSASSVKPFVGIEGTPVRACAKCGAPGVWQSEADPHWSVAVPGVCLPRGDQRFGRYVGEKCPNCYADRPPLGAPIKLYRGHPGWMLGRRPAWWRRLLASFASLVRT